MFKIGFLGGIAEFGNNCCFIEYQNEIIIIDIGFKFFTENDLGIRYEIPDFFYLFKNKKKIKGVIITHGHLDHIGGIPYFLNHVHCNIYSSHFTQHLIKKQLINKGHTKYLKTIDIKPFSIGQFNIEPFNVSHSILGSLGFIINTPLKDNTKLIFCGDIKNDTKPFFIKPNNFTLIDKYKKCPKILFLDSTNATEKGHNLSETIIYEEIKKIYKEFTKKSRLIFTTFSSQIERILEIIDASIKYNRKIYIIGRSIFENLKYILEFKEYQKYKKHIYFSEDELKEKEKITVIATGSQGEENSAIVKILNNKIKKFKINSNDLFIFTSSVIPGNEKKIFNIWNKIYSFKAEVISYKERSIHASGHGKVNELKKIIKRIKPDYLIPVHGEYRNLYNQKKLATEAKIDSKHILIMNKGDIIKINDNNQNKIIMDYNLQLKDIILDDENHIIDKKTIIERKKMVKNGILIINFSIKNIHNIKIKGIGISNFNSNEENLLKKKIIYEIKEKNNLENIIKIFFRENNLSCPSIIKV